MARKVHFSRLLDFISGSALAAANTKVQKSAIYRDFDLARLESKKLRELIDSNLPTLYVVNIDTITKELLNNLGFSNFKENEDYIRSKFPNKKELEQFIFNTVKLTIESIKEDSFTATIAELNKEYSKLLDSLNQRGTYTKYRNAATRFAFNMRTILKKSGVYRAVDADSIVANLTTNSYVIIGPTFNNAVEAVNKKLNDSLRQAFVKSYDITLKEYDAKADAKNRFTIGDYINAGHTAGYDIENRPIGINMPFAQEKQFLLSGDPKAEGLETEIASLYLEVDYAVKFQPNFVENAGNLLNMQFSFTVSMPTKFNTATLRIKEVERIRNYIGSQVLPTIAEQAKAKFIGGVLQDIIPNTGASPSLLDHVTSTVLNTIKGSPVKQFSSVNKASAKKIDGIPIFAVVKKPQKLNIKQKSGGTKTQTQKISVSKIPVSSLTKLQDLLDSQLQNQIKRNMGTGDRTDVLNYRTGRFAQSVKVKQITEGRSGLITAYYIYMRYPYATFSEGGNQQYPRSRDPKLLISKSIREIAQQAAITRLRAVLV